MTALFSACMAKSEPVELEQEPLRAPAELANPDAPVFRRLTQEQFKIAIADVFGSEIVVPDSIEPDVAYAGLYALGAANSAISSWGVEQYERAVRAVSDQLIEKPELLTRLMTCTTTRTVDDDCSRKVVNDVGTRLYRRPLSKEEADTFVALAKDASSTTSSFSTGLAFALSTMLQSPNFLYRVEIGEPDPHRQGRRVYTQYELASRLSFFLINGPPDEELITAAEAGLLDSDSEMAAQAERLIDSPRGRIAVRAFFSDFLKLSRLKDLEKDPKIFTFFNVDLRELAREETLRLVDEIVFEDKPYQELVTADHTYVDRRLAAVYGIEAPDLENFGRAELKKSHERRGFLGHMSFLATNAHAVSSSATRRGHFIRTALLCQKIPPPPSNVDTSLPEPSVNAATLRDRVADHLTNPSCAGCHKMMDPIGLGLERFDGIGRFRTTEGGAAIDPSGDVDGNKYDNSWELADRLAQHKDFAPCFVDTLYRYANGRLVTPNSEEMIAWLEYAFEHSNFRVKKLLVHMASHPGFRQVGEIAQ